MGWEADFQEEGPACTPEEQETTQFREFVCEKEEEDSSSLMVPRVYI